MDTRGTGYSPFYSLYRTGKQKMTEKQITQLLKGQQLSPKALVEKVEAFTTTEKEELESLLTHLMDQGVIGKHNNFYYLLSDDKVFLAKAIVKTRNFVVLKAIPDGFEAKISGREAEGLLVGDMVYAKEFQQNVYHCIEYYKPVTTLKGRYSLTRNGKEQLLVDYLNAAGKTVLINEIDPALEANQGDLLEGEITSFEGDVLTVNVKKLLVRSDDVGADISMIISQNGGDLVFPDAVMEEAKSIPQEVSKDDLYGREDFRGQTVVTIDGDDAHDFDDAVQAKRYGSGYEIVVHIADVTEYVKLHHPLDDEAVNRGTSIYVADRVVPMLPFELSNGICSLNPGVDRLTLSVTMDVDGQGNVFYTKIQRGVIRSSGRLTYNQVNSYFNGEKSSFSDEIKTTLDILREAASKIRRRRTINGAMKLSSLELKFHLDENGTPTSVIKQEQGESEKMIEDLMIITNCAVATELRRNKVPVLYRVHEFPPSEKISTFREYLKRVDLLSSFPKTENISGARLNDFLESIKDDNLKEAVNYMMLRAMSKARYSPEEIGHFGLAEMEYCHFTSPIRRYPDDIIHRLVKDYLIDKKSLDYEGVYTHLEKMGDHLSDCEVRADRIEREVDDLESAKYMANHIGETFHGKVVSLIQRGMFVETDLGIEGFLSYHCMHGDFFKFNEKAFAAFGKLTDMSFSIGTPIDVTVLSASPEKGEIDFATPEFYEEYALDLSEEERRDLSLNGIYVSENYSERPLMTGKARFYGEESDDMNNDYDDNLSAALENMEEKSAQIKDRDFRPTPEQWKEVDVIRAVLAKYPDDEEKVIQVLAVMDIDEEEYRKLLRFTKPREDKKERGRRPARGGRERPQRGGRSSFGRKPMSNRGERRERRSTEGYRGRSERKDDKKPVERKRKSFSDHQGYASARSERPSSTRRSTRSGYGRRSGDR